MKTVNERHGKGYHAYMRYDITGKLVHKVFTIITDNLLSTTSVLIRGNWNTKYNKTSVIERY